MCGNDTKTCGIPIDILGENSYNRLITHEQIKNLRPKYNVSVFLLMPHVKKITSRGALEWLTE